MIRRTLRLPDELYHTAQAYAQRLGISLNALVLVALDDYLRRYQSAEEHPQPSHPADPDQAKRDNQGKRKRKKGRKGKR